MLIQRFTLVRTRFERWTLISSSESIISSDLYKVQHPHTAANFSVFSNEKQNSISFHCKISHKNTVNFIASPSCHTSNQLWLRYTKIMIHHRRFCERWAKLSLYGFLMSFSTKTWRVEVKQVLMGRKVSEKLLLLVYCLKLMFIIKTQAYLNGIGFYHQLMSFNHLMIILFRNKLKRNDPLSQEW